MEREKDRVSPFGVWVMQLEEEGELLLTVLGHQPPLTCWDAGCALKQRDTVGVGGAELEIWPCSAQLDWPESGTFGLFWDRMELGVLVLPCCRLPSGEISFLSPSLLPYLGVRQELGSAAAIWESAAKLPRKFNLDRHVEERNCPPPPPIEWRHHPQVCLNHPC